MHFSTSSKLLIPALALALASCGGEAPAEAPADARTAPNAPMEDAVPVIGPERRGAEISRAWTEAIRRDAGVTCPAPAARPLGGRSQRSLSH